MSEQLDLLVFEGHTPEEWVLNPQSSASGCDMVVRLSVDMDGRNKGAIVYGYDGVNVRANARLIAAAPTLLAELKEARTALAAAETERDTYCKAWEEVREAGLIRLSDEVVITGDFPIVHASRVPTAAALLRKGEGK